MQSVVCWADNSSRARPADGYNFHVRGDVVQVRTLFRHHAQSHSTTTAPYVSIIFQMFFKNIRSHLGSPPGGDRSIISTEILVPGARRNSCEITFAQIKSRNKNCWPWHRRGLGPGSIQIRPLGSAGPPRRPAPSSLLAARGRKYCV